MLVLTRRQGESFRIGNDNKVTVLSIDGDRVELGVNDSEDVKIDREEERREG